MRGRCGGNALVSWRKATGTLPVRSGYACLRKSQGYASARGERKTHFLADAEVDALRGQMAKLPRYGQAERWRGGVHLELRETRICSRLAGGGFGGVRLDDVDGVAGERDLDGDEWVVAERGQPGVSRYENRRI